MGRERLLYRIPPLTPSPCEVVVLCGISTDFSVLSPCIGQLVHALLTRPPLEYPPKRISPFDLHVLSTPPAFVLSQDQTLILKVSSQLRLARVLRVPPASLKRTTDSSSLEFFGIDKSFSSVRSPPFGLERPFPFPFAFCLVLFSSCIVFKVPRPPALAGQLLYITTPAFYCQALFSLFPIYFWAARITRTLCGRPFLRSGLKPNFLPYFSTSFIFSTAASR